LLLFRGRKLANGCNSDRGKWGRDHVCKFEKALSPFDQAKKSATKMDHDFFLQDG